MYDRIIFAACALALVGCNAGVASSESPAKVAVTQPASDLVRFGSECEDWDDWDKPAKPFQIHANTYYVGTCGIAAILIVADDGLVLIDTGTEPGSQVVEANIAALGHSISAVKAILTSHEHFDHVGGLARLQALSRATVYTGTDAAPVLRTGKDDPRDPQAGLHEPMKPVAGEIRAAADGEVLNLAGTRITALATPGHTLGAMSWEWESCDGAGCVTIVLADSLSPVSADDYKFTEHPEYVAMFRKGIARMAGTNCDLLLTPHPSASDMIERAKTGSFVGGTSCADYADTKAKGLEGRLAKEASAK
ncbi:subclass B3 metallo-beta-lactamase [Altererythrobacter sp. Z27]|uniref:subclass B3 metallo-beta-lactamase n=1 Tax=Altererythrobacter sp. Z27 TaxID=3461147 RepID=UPI0040449319